MKKRFVVLLAFIAICFSGCVFSPPSQNAEEAALTSEPPPQPEKTYALIVKSMENPYMITMYEGFKAACAEMNVQPLFLGPGADGLPGQSEILGELLTKKVEGIAVAANDMREVSPLLKTAAAQKTAVVSLDSMVDPADRQVHIQQASPEIIGRVLVQACAKMMDYSGSFAILTTTATMPNQSTWVEWMNRELRDHPETYRDMTLVETAYGLDEEAPSAEETTRLLKTYPDLKMIIAPTVVGLRAAAAEIKKAGSDCLVTGLGLPSEMEPFIADGICPWMYLWNPSELGYLAAYALDALSCGQIGGSVGEILFAGSLGEKVITKSTDGGTEVVLGNPKVFDMTNIAVWGELF